MSPTKAAPADAEPKRGNLTGAALTDEVFDSSSTLLRNARGRTGAVTGLQQYFSPPEAARLIALVNGPRASTLDLTAGNGALLADVNPKYRFGIEIDHDQIEADSYEAIQGDVRHAVPLLRLVGTKFPRVACNPPFGLDWKVNGRTQNSTVAAWQMAISLLADDGAGAFIAGRDRFLRDVADRPDAAGIYALVECEDLFDGVGLPCLIAFFIHPRRAERLRELVSSRFQDSGDPLRLSAPRSELAGLGDEIVAERERRGVYFIPQYRCPHRDSLVERFAGVRNELTRRREKAASSGTYLRQLGGGKLAAPYGIAVDGEGRVWVSDVNKIVEFKDRPRATFPSRAKSPPPAGLGLDPEGDVWIAEVGANRISELEGTSSGYVGRLRFGAAGSGTGQLSQPYDIKVKANGNLLVADRANNRVQQFSPDGELQAAFGAAGAGAGQLNEPSGVAVGRGGLIFVTDSGNKRVQRWSGS